MGCCQSRLKDAKEKSNFNDDDESCINNERTINDLIGNNMKKRHKSFLTIAQKKLAMQNSDFV